MLKRGRKAQIQLSFGMIFSIIIIVVTILVAGYVIIKFMSSQDNAKCKLFYQKLQDTIDDSWKGDGSSIDVPAEDWLIYSPETMTILQNEHVSLPIVIEVPKNAPKGEYIFNVKVLRGDDNELYGHTQKFVVNVI